MGDSFHQLLEMKFCLLLPVVALFVAICHVAEGAPDPATFLVETADGAADYKRKRYGTGYDYKRKGSGDYEDYKRKRYGTGYEDYKRKRYGADYEDYKRKRSGDYADYNDYKKNV